MVIDVISFNGEFDMLELRLNILGDVVDQFIITEGRSTFAGNPKELTFDIEKFKPWKDKIKYFVIEDEYSDEEVEAARVSKYTIGHPRWMHEFLQKEGIKRALTHLRDDDICFIGDVDEIWNMNENLFPLGCKLKLRVYSYFLNYRSNEEFWGPICYPYGYLKDECLNNLRNETDRTLDYAGWHFTSQGGLEAVQKKMKDNANEVFNSRIISMLPYTFGKSDYIGRNFTFKVDESDWPQYLKDNREKYDRLLYKSA
jgi:hypothetical protein